MPNALKSRLAVVYDDAIAVEIQNGHYARGAYPTAFGAPIADVHVIMPHETSTMPNRTLSDSWRRRYVHGGIGPQYYIAWDGSTQSLINEDAQAYVTWHGRQASTYAVGIETGHPWGTHTGDDRLGPNTGHGWRRLAPAGTTTDDVPGMNAWITRVDTKINGVVVGELVVGWWTTRSFVQSWAPSISAQEMVFNEQQYRAWALLGRFLAEQYLVPRNFPLLPYVGREGMQQQAAKFKRIVLADEVLSRAVARGALTISKANFDALDARPAEYNGKVVQVMSSGQPICDAPHYFPRNPIWSNLTATYRGFYSHAFGGDDACGGEHDCPGPLFDWHRFAREVWDWWWHPFDFDAMGTTTAVPLRPYTSTDGATTPLVEYYYSRPESDYTPRAVPSIHGATAAPQTFDLDAQTPVYALANGELVAARFPAEGDKVSAAFVLVRHEVFHQLDQRQFQPIAAPTTPPSPPLPAAGRLDYDAEPSYVYSLYMHLGRPSFMSFTEVTPFNPGWLNRVLQRKKECDLGVAFYAANAAAIAADPATQALWAAVPAGTPARPNLLTSWITDQIQLTTFMSQLASGDIALAPLKAITDASSIRIQLGEHLAIAGVRQRGTAGTKLGVRVEVFSPLMLSADWQLVVSTQASGWNPPATVPADKAGPCVFYPSEWARVPAGAERTALEAVGVDVSLVPWWRTVAARSQVDTGLPAAAKLNLDGWVYHYKPHDFMRWINQATWRSEWSKYKLEDTTVTPHVPLALPTKPQPRV